VGPAETQRPATAQATDGDVNGLGPAERGNGAVTARAGTSPLGIRRVAALVTAVACAAAVLAVCRWHSPENFFWFNSRSIPWSYLWTVALLAAVLLAVTAFLLRGLVAALAWVGGALLALSAIGLWEAF
jgi:hypothetical protein